MYNEKGTNISKIEFKEEKLQLMINQVKNESSERKIGKAALTVRLMLVEVVITPTVLSSTETWHNITKHEQQQLKKIHHQILTKTLLLPNSTPYLGIISELNIIPFVDCVWYKKFMWYHQLLNSEEERHATHKDEPSPHTDFKDYSYGGKVFNLVEVIRSYTRCIRTHTRCKK